MSKSRWLKLLGALFAFSLLAAACGDDSDDSASTDTTTEDAVEAEAPGSEAPR